MFTYSWINKRWQRGFGMTRQSLLAYREEPVMAGAGYLLWLIVRGLLRPHMDSLMHPHSADHLVRTYPRDSPFDKLLDSCHRFTARLAFNGFLKRRNKLILCNRVLIVSKYVHNQSHLLIFSFY